MPNPELARQWRHRFNRFDNANETIAEFCYDENVSVSAFYYWRKRLGSTTPPAPDFAPLIVQPIVGPGSDHDHRITIDLPGGAVLRIDRSTQVQGLTQTLRAVLAATADGAQR